MKDTQTIIKLDIVDICRDDNTYYEYTVGYYSSYELVEKVMYALYVNREDSLFFTEEIQLDTIINNEDYYLDYVIHRQYRWVGDKIKMIHETPYYFNGYKSDEDYQYKVGDIIEYLDRNNKIGVSIIGSVPIKYDEKKVDCIDFTDDSYIVYDLGEGDTHDHIMTNYIIGLANIRPDTYKAYKDKLKERMKTW